MSLSETVVDHIDCISLLTEESADLLGANTNHKRFLIGCPLGLISWEHVLWPINILAEVEIVYFLSVATVTVTANDQVEHGVTGRHNIEVFHDAKELLSRYVLRL